MGKLFAAQKVNTGRQIEWDFAKVFAIVLMIVTHYFAFCSFGNVDYGKTTDIMFILTQCSAPIFMFAMGIGMAYTRHDSPREFIVRGIKLLLLGLIINIMYFLSNYAAGVPLEYSLLSFIANDILQFAGLSFILIGIFKRFNVRTIKIFIISIGFSLVATYFSDFTFSNMYLNQFLGHFIETQGLNIVSCFPILNWFIIPVCGMLFGENLIRCNDKDELYTRIIKPTHSLTFIMLVVGLITLEGMFSVTGGTVPEKLMYLHASLPDIVILIIVSLFFGSLFYFVAKRSSPAVIDFIRKSSGNVTVIYIIQWALILFLTYINQFLHIETNLGIAIAVLILIIIASFILSEAYVKVKRHFLH
ncbi:heparan-alpha-glucosaminide N-acetyltransferase domain-containing protein [Methanobrevibacter sp.]|uniref:heparan-alpha-glucosaminide N-acetyltransferase domain-containing protein n=1 Tax=Methanobrevibacter sp. TaxID=66852 RepID=UPI00388F45E4